MPPPRTPTLPFKCSLTKDWALLGRLGPGEEELELAEESLRRLWLKREDASEDEPAEADRETGDEDLLGLTGVGEKISADGPRVAEAGPEGTLAGVGGATATEGGRRAEGETMAIAL